MRLNFQVASSLVVLALSVGLFRVLAQQEEQQSGTRNLWNAAFAEQRPVKKKTTIVNSVKTAPSPKAVASLGDSFVGVTLWRMRRSVSSDPVTFRGLVHPDDSGDVEEWTPERSPLAKPLATGEFVRLSIESARKGYLYVINRDVYGDGTESGADLIFPTTRLRKGDNAVVPGRPIEIPDAADRPPVYRLERTRMDQTSVKLIILVAPEPIAEVKVGPQAQRLPDELVAAWQKRWGAGVQVLDAAEDAGKVYTTKEQAAAKDRSAALSDADPVPMTLFHCGGKKSQPMMIAVQIKLEQ